MFKVKDLVKIKEEWADELEKTLTYVVTEINETMQRCWITTKLPNMTLPTSNLVSFDMIEKIDSLENYDFSNVENLSFLQNN